MRLVNRNTRGYNSAMPQSTRFPSAVHILTLLAVKTGQCVSSECLAKSLGTNAVVVRRLLARLQQAGMVATQPGAQGGARLVVDAGNVTLLDVYRAVEDQSVFRMHQPHPDCPIAALVRDDVWALLTGAEEEMQRQLARTKLAEVAASARKRIDQAP